MLLNNFAWKSYKIPKCQLCFTPEPLICLTMVSFSEKETFHSFDIEAKKVYDKMSYLSQLVV